MTPVLLQLQVSQWIPEQGIRRRATLIRGVSIDLTREAKHVILNESTYEVLGIESYAYDPPQYQARAVSFVGYHYLMRVRDIRTELRTENPFHTEHFDTILNDLVVQGWTVQTEGEMNVQSYAAHDSRR